MEDEWIFLGDDATGAGGSDSDSASEAGSDSDSGFTMIVRRGRKGDAPCSSVAVVRDDGPAPPPVAAVAVPQPMLPGLSFKVVSYSEAFSASASASSSSEDGGGGGREQSDSLDEAIAGESIQGAGVDVAAGTGSADDGTVTCKCKEGCESGQAGVHDGTGSSVEAPSVAVAAAPPTVNCPVTNAVLHGGEAHSELASGVEQGGAKEVEDEDSESCEEDDDDMDTSSEEEEEEDDDMDTSSDEDTDSSGDEEDDDTGSSGDEEDGDTFSYGDEEEEDTFSYGDEEDVDRFSYGDYTESFSEEEYTAEIYSEEEEDDDDAECSGEEEEARLITWKEESRDADSTGDDEEEEEDDDDAESTGEEEGAESTGKANDDDDPEISGDEESDAECSGDEDGVDSSDDEPEYTESSGADSDVDADSCGEEEEEEEEDAESCGEEEELDGAESCGEEEEQKEDTVSAGDEESSHVVDVAESGKKDIFAVLFPRATTACDANGEQGAANANGAVKEQSEFYPRKHDDIDDDSSDMDCSGSDEEDDIDMDCSESDEEDGVVDVAEDIFAMLLPKETACHAADDDYAHEIEHGHIDYEEEAEDIFAKDTACHANIADDFEDESEHDGHIDHEEMQDIFAMLLPKETACHANIDDSDYEDEGEHGYINDYKEVKDVVGMLFSGDRAIDDDIDSSDGEEEAATATAACGDSAEPSLGTRRPLEFGGRAGARGYDDVDTDSDMDEVAADVNATSLYGLLTGGGGVESQCRGFASQSQAERQALWEALERRVLEQDLVRQLAVEASESSAAQQTRSYDDVDDTCDVPHVHANIDDSDNEDKDEHGYINDYEEVKDIVGMLFSGDRAIDDDITSSDGEEEAATATATATTAACGHNAEPSHGTRRPAEFAGQAGARGYDDVDTDSDVEEGDDEVAAGTSLDGLLTGGGVASQCCGFASPSQAERQAMWEERWALVERRVVEHLRQLAAEASESSAAQQPRSYDDVDDTCDVPGTAAHPGGGGPPAGSCACACARTAEEAPFTVRDGERAAAIEEVRRREAAQRELDRALAREAAAAAQALESALQVQGCPTADKRQATGVARPAVAEPRVRADITFIIGVYVLLYLVVSLLSLALPRK